MPARIGRAIEPGDELWIKGKIDGLVGGSIPASFEQSDVARRCCEGIDPLVHAVLRVVTWGLFLELREHEAGRRAFIASTDVLEVLVK